MASDAEVGESFSYARDTASLAGLASAPPDVAALRERQIHALDEQIEVLRLQKHHLAIQIADAKREDRVRHWSLRVRHVNDVMKLVFAVGVAFFVIVASTALGALIWNASDAKGLVVQPFRVPQDIAARGLDGTVLARRLLDKLNGLVQAADTFSIRSPDAVAGNWGDDSKVEIPDTGISILELSRFLRGWLGHETTMSGEIVHAADGVAITVRVGTNPGVTYAGKEADLDALIGSAARGLLAQTQPYRYVGLLLDEGHPASEIVPIAQNNFLTSVDIEKHWASSQLSEQLTLAGKWDESVRQSAVTIAEAPNNPIGEIDYTSEEYILGRAESAYHHDLIVVRMLQGQLPSDFAAEAAPFLLANGRQFADELGGAFSDAVSDDVAEAITNKFNYATYAFSALADDYALDHDATSAKKVLADHKWQDENLLDGITLISIGPTFPQFFISAATDDWPAARKALEHFDALASHRPDAWAVQHSWYWPWLAYADARTGDHHAAQVLIGETRLDCTLCLEMRGRIAELTGNTREAADWYRRAMADGPSIPFAATDLGRMLMKHGDYDGAIAQFADAHKRSPHYPDALELWGEALMQQNRSDLALAKFEEANKYAPRWGRLHIKWGEALLYLGRKDEARTQFQAAAAMDMSTTDRARVDARLGAPHG